jgi:hypothetical protein
MSGFPSLPGASSLLAAQAASFNKGQETTTSNSTERQEKERKRNLMVFLTRQTEDLQKTEDAQRGFLA